MKRGTPGHPKMLDLAEAVLGHWKANGGLFAAVSFDVAHTFSVGMMERLWHFAARYAQTGLVPAGGAAIRIARAVGWPSDAEWLIRTLAELHWIDELEGRGWYVHDWHVHAEDAVDKWLSDNELSYANGSPTRRLARAGPKVVEKSRDKSRLPKPKPKPKPSSPLPPSVADGPPSPNGRPIADVEDAQAGRLAGRSYENTWAGVREHLTAAGVDYAVPAARAAEANGWDPDHAHAVIRFGVAHGKGPGAIVERFMVADRSLPLNRGWPDTPAPEAVQQAESEAQRRKRERQAQEQQDSAATALIKHCRRNGITTDEAIKAELAKQGLKWPSN